MKWLCSWVQDIRPKTSTVPVGPRLVRKADVLKCTYDGHLPVTRNPAASSWSIRRKSGTDTCWAGFYYIALYCGVLIKVNQWFIASYLGHAGWRWDRGRGRQIVILGSRCQNRRIETSYTKKKSDNCICSSITQEKTDQIAYLCQFLQVMTNI